jgi:putative hydrolase of the HAD superfamily
VVELRVPFRPMLPRVILLDLDDTILDDTGGAAGAWEQACREAGAPDGLPDAIREAGAWFWSEPDRHRSGRADLLVARRTIVETALARRGLPDDGLSGRIATRLNELRDAAIAPLPGAVEALDELRRRGVTLGLITNGSALHQRWKLDRFGLAAHFDYIGIEGEAGVGKPEPEAFQRALGALQADARESWMVGDNLTYDVGGAQAVGIHAIWLDARRRGLPDPPPAVPDRIIRSIAELLD